MTTATLGMAERIFSGFWTPVEERLPIVGQVNGYWCTSPVIVALADGRVVGAFFSYHGGDAMDVDDDFKPLPEHRKPVPSFHTDEGLEYEDVLFWAAVPKHPTINLVPKTYA